MIAHKETIYTKDPSNKKMKVIREFDAPVEAVWKAWTDASLLDQWWAPHPWKARTQSMDFKDGGTWFYYMEGPKGEKQHSRADYTGITPLKEFSGDDAFCDEKGERIENMPTMHWKNTFAKTKDGTRVTSELTFPTAAALDKTVEMGFKEGFAAAHQNLDELLERNI
ncbi:SRPBCC family protein [Flavihumibacter petaseus]|uniref:Activator of Hsp90 ATPase homologue 1/2-like C-terminal domain-containing protein n=1 Tax=Flavihumibacter petaseus NBRC 106054 TaxID=1220578 RepID=A0A0E9MTX7_9BACT|nr:SRPBCC domain-containing protein [Flavihumibacter petaseus]GAO41019.1 hypothetical protein FPE01S_01_00310 [Flavihumibacter petaseus NBRC 106054]